MQFGSAQTRQFGRAEALPVADSNPGDACETIAAQPDCDLAGNGRHAPRKSFRSAALVRFEGVRCQVSCLVQDISATGAKLRLQLLDAKPFDPTMALPETFKLVLPNDRLEIDCKLAWRRINDIGVVFSSNFQPVRMVGKRRD